jgi:hypothetical protein
VRARLVAVALGPVCFVTAWAVAGARRTDGYDPVADAISRLASADAPDRWLMTAGLVAFGLLVPLGAPSLGRALGSRALTACLVGTGLATLGVAATPLSAAGGQPVDAAHAVLAGTGYATLAAVPLLAARRLPPRLALPSYAVGAASAAALVGSVTGPAPGLCQRVGLGVVDAWLVVAALVLLRRRRLASRA